MFNQDFKFDLCVNKFSVDGHTFVDNLPKVASDLLSFLSRTSKQTKEIFIQRRSSAIMFEKRDPKTIQSYYSDKE